jgi:hypothetical protein
MMSRIFDGYLVVDWSANSRPKTGKDSIWWCHLQADTEGSTGRETQNPATRQRAYAQIKSILLDYKRSNRRLLVGMDFSYGYPQGFAQHLQPKTKPSWKAVWQYLHEHIVDDVDNSNNRFQVAAAINRRLSHGQLPFWGCPASQQSPHLSMKMPGKGQKQLFDEFRIVERGSSAQSVWKLLYAGSVGSQVLMGLPYLYRLLFDDEMQEVSRVWPFQTGLKALHHQDFDGINILHAEVYPSLIEVKGFAGEIKDRLQVQTLAQHFSRLDEAGELHALFAGLQPLTSKERDIVEQEEGWILGM